MSWFQRGYSLSDVHRALIQGGFYRELPSIPYHDRYALEGRSSVLAAARQGPAGLSGLSQLFRELMDSCDRYRLAQHLPVIAEMDQTRRLLLSSIETAARYECMQMHFKYSYMRGMEAGLALMADSVGLGKLETGEVGSERWDSALLATALGPLDWHLKQGISASFQVLLDGGIQSTSELFTAPRFATQRPAERYEKWFNPDLSSSARSSLSTCPCGCRSNAPLDRGQVAPENEWTIGLY